MGEATKLPPVATGAPLSVSWPGLVQSAGIETDQLTVMLSPCWMAAGVAVSVPVERSAQVGSTGGVSSGGPSGPPSEPVRGRAHAPWSVNRQSAAALNNDRRFIAGS